MTCAHCGTVAEPGDGFCRGCGRGLASLANASSIAAAPPEAPKPIQDFPQPEGLPAAGPSLTGAARWGESGTRPFLYGGLWYSRSGDTLYQYDPAGLQWIVRNDAAIPYFMRRPAFASLRTPALVLYGLFALFVAFSVVAGISDGYQFSTFQDFADGKAVAQSELDGARAFWDLARVLQSFAILSIVPVFIWWTRRATCNVRALGAEKPEFSPAWAIAWWFIPFAMWVQPGRVLNQAWRASDPTLPTEESSAWRKAKLTAWLPIWWVSYWLISTAWSFPINLLDTEDLTASEIAGISIFALVFDILMAVLAVGTVLVVRALTRRQERANERFEASAQAG